MKEKIKFLFQKFDEKTLGRIFQLMLSLTLLRLGFKIIECKLSGRPDIEAIKNLRRYSIEVKISKTDYIILKNTDLNGVMIENFTPIIAVFWYNLINPKWLILDAKQLRSGKLYIPTLESNSIKKLENDVNEEFPSILSIHWESIKSGEKKLLVKFKEELLLQS